jgi:hypothetical protein
LALNVYSIIYRDGNVNGYIYMDFREALDALCSTVDHRDVAEALGVSLQTVRQARMSANSSAFRAPPKGWEDSVIRLAEKRVTHYRKLISKLIEDRE